MHVSAHADEVAMQIEEMECNTPESLKKRLLEEEPCEADRGPDLGQDLGRDLGRNLRREGAQLLYL